MHRNGMLNSIRTFVNFDEVVHWHCDKSIEYYVGHYPWNQEMRPIQGDTRYPGGGSPVWLAACTMYDSDTLPQHIFTKSHRE